MKMKKSKYLQFGVYLLIFLSLSVASCEQENNDDVNKIKDPFKIYLAKENLGGLIPIYVDYNGKKNEKDIIELVNYLKVGTINQGISTLPSDIDIEEIKIIKNSVRIYFNEKYSELDYFDEMICRSSLVKTLTEIEGIDTIEIYVEGLPLKDHDGYIFGAMNSSDVIVNFNDFETIGTKKTVTLYFSNNTGDKLIPMSYEMKINKNEKVEKTIVDLLIKGSNNGEYNNLIPREVKVKNVYTNEGVCYIDFSEELVTKHIGGSTAELLTIYSIVNTLTELPNISQVRFLIEGQIREEFKGHMKFDVLFKRNLDLVGDE